MTIKKQCWFTAFLAATLGTMVLGGAGSLAAPIVIDAPVTADIEDVNYDGFETIHPGGSGNGQFRLEHHSDRRQRIALEFPLSAIGGGVDAETAVLFLDGVSCGACQPPGQPLLEVYGYHADGSITLADATRIGDSGTVLLGTAGPGTLSAFNDLEFSIVDFINDLLDQGATHAGILLRLQGDEAENSQEDLRLGIASPDNAIADRRLRLTVTTVAVPAPTGLGVLFLAGCLAAVRRRR